jgi:hypothetical protein
MTIAMRLPRLKQGRDGFRAAIHNQQGATGFRTRMPNEDGHPVKNFTIRLSLDGKGTL